MTSSTLKVIGYVFAVCLTVHAQAPAQKTNSSTISGKVTFKGNGVPGIAVGARLTQSGNPRNVIVVTTDQQGNYRITNVPPGQYEITPAAPQFVIGNQAPTKRIIVGEREDLGSVDFALVRGGVITGKVTDADGRPMIEEPIEVFSLVDSNPKLVQMNIHAGPTDDRGVYRIYGLRPGKYRVAAGSSEDRLHYLAGRQFVYGQTFYPSTTEESEATLIEVTEGSEATNVDITLRRPLKLYTVHARVVDGETGKPVANAFYGLHRFRENGSTSTTGFPANRLGEIKIENVTPGKYAIFLDLSPGTDRYSEPVHFEVVDQDVKDLVIKTSSGNSVSGVVVFDAADQKLAASKPSELIVFARVENKNPHMHGSSANGIINPDGSFKVGGVEPGVIHFAIWGRRQGPMAAFEITQIERDGVVQSSVEIKPGEHITGLRLIVKTRTAQIRGVIKLENGHTSFSQVNVTVRKVGEIGGRGLQVDDRGRFMSEPLAAGAYEIVVHTHRLQSRPITTKQQVVVADNQVTEVTVTVDLKSDTGQGRP